MALRIGKNDRFERLYMANFRAIAAQFGEFVEYERDRAGRDLGLHFVSQKNDGGEIVAPALVWFQMKGFQESTLSSDEYEALDDLRIVLDVGHLRFWYIAPEPTYLALYIEAVDQFFILNIQKYVAENYGDNILTLNQKNLTVSVSKKSQLDEQAFRLIKDRRSVAAWQDRIAEGREYAPIFFRDANLIWRLSTAENRKASIKFILRKYGSKLRSEAYFSEEIQGSDAEPEIIRTHWQYMMPEDLTRVFPYVEFNPAEGFDYDEDDLLYDEEEWEWPAFELPNGKQVVPDGVFELVEYEMTAVLNDIGQAWAQTLGIMRDSGFIEIDEQNASSVSVAPWHVRDV